MNNDSESTPICPGHALPARLWWTKKQPPRQFYRCSKPIGEQCKFFEWVSPQELTSSQSNVLPPTPNSAMPFSQTRPESPSTPTPASRNVRPDSSIDPLQSPTGLAGTQASQPDDASHANMEVSKHEHISRSDDVPDLSSEVVSDMIRQLRALPTYLKKLEKQKVDADNSRRAHNTAIIYLQEQVDQLEAEVTRLKAREGELEKIIATRFES